MFHGPRPKPLPRNARSIEQSGFTLIELMVAVGIIGILVSISSPMYGRYQRKARQSEAKLAVGAIYALEKAFYSEYAAYAPSFDAIGYSPEGGRRFYYQQVTNDAVAHTGTITGYSGSLGTPWYSNYNSPFPWAGSFAAANTCNLGATYNGASMGNDPQIFVGIAQGNLYASGTTDRWEINHLKVLANCSVGI